MLKSFNEDFDLQVRSMMDQAQEPAPAGAWEAISSRLDALAAAGLQPAASEAPAFAGAGARPVRRVWYWAGAALAMAAAVALGIFFTGTADNNSNLINISDGEGLVAQEIAPLAEPVLSDNPEPVQEVKLTAVHAEVAEPAEIAESAEAAEPVKVSDPVEVAGQDGTVETSETAETPGTVKTVEPVAAADPADPFARMAFEDSRKAFRRSPVSLTVSGGSTSNNAGAGNVALAAPGAYFQDGITEKSQSSFGIPLIIGLGVKFPISDVLSIGTGLDYSILTRTFEGRYTEGASVKDGDFNHTLQYIGIPVDLSLKLLTRNDITLYSTVGAEAEYAIYNKYRLLGTDTVVGEKVNGLQWSVGGGLGLEFNVSGHFGIFAEPSVKYYFDCGQPKSIRTDKPFQMVLRLGVRFAL